MSGAQLARCYRVHRDVIYRHLKSTGAVKGRLVQEATRQLHVELDIRQGRRLVEKWEDESRRLDAFIESGAAVERFMKALIRADREDTLVEFGRRLPAL